MKKTVTEELTINIFGDGSKRIAIITNELPSLELLDGVRILVAPDKKQDLIDYVRTTPIDDVAA